MLNRPNKPTHPCTQKCPDRTVGCATTCTKWKKYVEARDAYYDRRIKYREATSYDDSSIYRLHPND